MEKTILKVGDWITAQDEERWQVAGFAGEEVWVRRKVDSFGANTLQLSRFVLPFSKEELAEQLVSK